MQVKPVNIQDWAKWLQLETFDDPQMDELIIKCATFVRAMRAGEQPRWLVLLGTSGAGKTHCAKRIWKQAHASFETQHCDYMPALIFWPEYIERLRDGMREGNGLKYFLDMIRWPFAVLDDVGAGRDATGFAADKLNTLLSGRVGKWTIITSNLSLDGIAKIDTRIASRIVREPGNLYIDLDMADYGLRKK